MRSKSITKLPVVFDKLKKEELVFPGRFSILFKESFSSFGVSIFCHFSNLPVSFINEGLLLNGTSSSSLSLIVSLTHSKLLVRLLPIGTSSNKSFCSN